MKRYIPTLLIFIVFAGLTGSCNEGTPKGVITSPTAVSVLTSTIFPITLSPAATTAPTATSITISQFNFSCWTVKPLTKENDIKGNFVYAHYASSQRNEVDGLFTWNISSFQSMDLNGNKFTKLYGESYVSPDGKIVAILSDKSLILISREGIQSFSLPEENLSIRAYLADGRILLTQDNSNNYKEGIGLTVTYYIFNPAMGTTATHTVFLPGFEADLTWDVWTLQYSPDVKYVLYRSTHSEDDIEFTLYDLVNNKVVWVGPPRESNLKTSWDSAPDWQPNTNSLTAHYIDINTRKTNYYSINLSGKVSLITNLNGIELGNTVIPSRSSWSYRAESPNWSPDGRYLVAAGLQDEDSPSWGYGTFMYIWDTQEQIGYKPCLPNERQTTSLPILGWSFNGSYAIVNLTFGGPGQYAYGKSYILDLVNKVIYEMPDDNQKEFTNMYKDGVNGLLGWVDWESP